MITKEKLINVLLNKRKLWNRYSELCSNKNIIIDLRYTALSKADLRHANLSYTALSKADLRHANLRYADLRCADLRHADLRHADLRHADLRYAILNFTDLYHANLRYADLRYAILDFTDLSYADLRYAILNFTDLHYANLMGADLDFGCLDLSCKTLGAKFDEKHIIQFLYHALKPIQNNKDIINDKEIKKLLKNKMLLRVVNKFHRVDECGRIEF